ncbi:MAG: LPS export ABC transporter permease LptG [Bacteriovoracia bacterium]
MRILARYVSEVFIKNFLMALLGLTLIYLFQAVMGMLFDNQFPLHQILIYKAMELPEIMVQVCAPAVLVSTVLCLGGLNRSNELTACYSIGIGFRQIVVILLSLIFMISCLTLATQDRVLPMLFKRKTTYYWHDMKKRTDFVLDLRQDKIWYRSKNLIYNLRTFDPANRTIHGMVIYTFDDDFRLAEVTEAKSATYNDANWKLMDGTVTVFTGSEGFPLTKKFEQKELVIGETPKDFQEIEKEVGGLRLKELYRYIQRTRENGIDAHSYEVRFHSRISQSFVPIVMCFLALPFSTRNRREGGAGAGKDVVICLGFSFLYLLFQSIGLSLGENGALPPLVSAWLPSVIFLGLAVALITYRRKTA